MSTRQGRGRAATSGWSFSGDPDDFEIGGLPDNFNGKILEWEYLDYDFNGSNEYESPGCLLVISMDNGEADQTDPTFYGLGGNVGDWEFAPDGQTIRSGPKGTLNKSSGMAKLLSHMIEKCGAPREGLKNWNGDMSQYLDMEFHWDRIDNDDVTSNREDGRKNQNLLPTSLAGQGRSGRRSSAGGGNRQSSGRNGASNTAPPVDEESTVEITDEHRDLVAAALGEGRTRKMAAPTKINSYKSGDFAGDDWNDIRKEAGTQATIEALVEEGFLEENRGQLSVAATENGNDDGGDDGGE